ncbi:phosphogluconate dehydratase [Asticcacaulis biprosthecium C19]|uniref:Phosphogluconate dehydratase n=1 Tax=Asticcacaulis biprosthecium C19 TaxID=715226 RepID=F4QPL1_9CAUL|nr:phosphogluconate dehydratase [Asticcacaulis biprosthecium]EGF91269.1 phosphogluconate dehydratase [Asticcacaulis biprosthecium C19]
MTQLHPVIAEVTAAIADRSTELRAQFMRRADRYKSDEPRRKKLSCANYAHVVAASTDTDKLQQALDAVPNIGIVTSYNDMLSAHQPYHDYPEKIRAFARKFGATTQVAGGVPAMCDGVTQGRPGMELSLFSRDVIAMSTAISLSHDAFDAALMLGICDKIVPGLVIGALSFAHLPIIFVPSGPMSSGLPNPEKAKIRTMYALGQVGRDKLLEAEMASYHAAGTCTFYGTANSNQMLMEMMGLHVPGAAFVSPGTGLRDALTNAAVERAAKTAENSKNPKRMADVIDVRAIVNGVIGLLATGGSTNHALHLPAMARAAGYILTLEDMDKLSSVVPLLARVYPNGAGDVNHFHAAGGIGFVIRELLSAGLLHGDVTTIWGEGMEDYTREPYLQDGVLTWRDSPEKSLDETILRGVASPFSPEGGLREIKGNIGRAVAKVSAVKPEHQVVEGPCVVFDDQDDFLAAFKAKELPQGDFVCVVRFQGPKANGMPELHSLTPGLSSILDAGRKVALVSDGRMSGASGKVPAVIHLVPEAMDGGPIAKLRNGDLLRVDCEKGTIDYLGDAAEFAQRANALQPEEADGVGRELFAHMRRSVGPADAGGAVFW